MRALVLAEYYPRAADPTLGVWTHRQTLAAREAGAEVRVLVLHRPLPPLAALRALDLSAIRDSIRQPRTAVLDGIEVEYLRYLSPPRPWSYASWGTWAAPWLRRALAGLREEFPFELIHAHYAVPAGDAARRAAPEVPLVVSVHGGDVHEAHAGSPAVRRTLSHARIVLANSAGTARRCAERGAGVTRVVHLGADPPPESSEAGATGARPEPGATPPTLVTVGNLVARKRHVDVISALARLGESHPDLRYVIVGEGPERERLISHAAALRVSDRVEFRGALPHDRAVATAQAATLFVLPSVAEAFGVAYVEAMAGAVPAIGSRGEDGPEEIAAAGGGIALVPPHDPAALAAEIEALLGDPRRLLSLGRAARATVAREFTWRRCGEQTVAAYAEVLDGRN
jgi:glycosyltransferase involved in cell wall biosynthesis